MGNLPAINKQSYSTPAELAFLSSEASVLDTENYANYKRLFDEVIDALKSVDIIGWIDGIDIFERFDEGASQMLVVPTAGFWPH
jgi:hypothetical protein